MRKILMLFIISCLLSGLCSCGTTTQDREAAESESIVDSSALETNSATEIVSTDTQPSESETASTPVDEDVVASLKEQYSLPLYVLISSLPTDKPSSNLRQANVDCDTLQWFNATYSIFTYHSGGDYHKVGGYSDADGYVDSYVTNGLKQSWGITDRTSAIESLAGLAISGHTPNYVESIELMDKYDLLTCTEVELRSFFAELAQAGNWTTEESADTINYYLFMRKIYDACGQNGIDAWDYCRIMQVSGNCYYAGYITLEECLTIQLATAQVIQEQFDSWESMNTSYLKGYAYWSYGTSASVSREWAYKKLTYEEDCPFKKLDFKMKLEKFW